MIVMILIKLKRKIKIIFVKNYLWLIHRKKITGLNDYSKKLNILNGFVAENCKVKYTLSILPKLNSCEKHKWVGAQIYNKKVYCIPNDETKILELDEECHFIDGVTSQGLFKWTGGCIWDNCLISFPRKANAILKYNFVDKTISENQLTYSYDIEHHYGGVSTKEGVIFQPPRNTDHILATDLKTNISHKIYIAPKRLKMQFRYSGSIIHPNGLIYFFPENKDKVIVLNPKNEEWTYISKPISTMVFDAKVGIDGNIYGFSAYNNGIMRINVEFNEVEMIHSEINPGAYGTKMGINGKLYSVPGDGNYVWCYDSITDECEKVFSMHDASKAKYAGGCTANDGSIFLVPATANSVLKFKPSNSTFIPRTLYYDFFNDFY